MKFRISRYLPNNPFNAAIKSKSPSKDNPFVTVSESGKQTISWSRRRNSTSINTILRHNDIGSTQVGVPVIKEGFIDKIGYSTRGTRNGNS